MPCSLNDIGNICLHIIIINYKHYRGSYILTSSHTHEETEAWRYFIDIIVSTSMF